MSQSFLIGNAFPLSLIHKKTTIFPESIDSLHFSLKNYKWESFWGHANTLEIANSILGEDLTPKTERPAIVLDDALLPSLNGQSYSTCWILSPNYTPGFRPSPNTEVSPDKILSWHVLRMTWH